MTYHRRRTLPHGTLRGSTCPYYLLWPNSWLIIMLSESVWDFATCEWWCRASTRARRPFVREYISFFSVAHSAAWMWLSWVRLGKWWVWFRIECAGRAMAAQSYHYCCHQYSWCHWFHSNSTFLLRGTTLFLASDWTENLHISPNI